MARFWLTQLALVTLNIILDVLFVMANTDLQDFCGSVFETQVDYALIGQVMGTATVVDEFECQLKCLGNYSCKSFNLHPDGNNANHTLICELNNKSRQMEPDYFKWKKGSTYYGSVQVSCIDGSHVNSKRTQNRQCHPGYAGKRCSDIVAMKGSHPNYPAHSCKDIREIGGYNRNGEYWIDPENNGNPLKVYCDMTTDGGGWLLVANIVIKNDTPPSDWNPEQTYRGISNYNNNAMGISKNAMNELRTHLSFNQLRFHCSKQQGRTFHVTTVANSTGEAVVQYFSGQTDVKPASCGSFVRMEDDNSRLAEGCPGWGYDELTDEFYAGEWGFWDGFDDMSFWDGFDDMMYNHACFVAFEGHWVIGRLERWKCDDYDSPVSPNDFWKIYVR